MKTILLFVSVVCVWLSPVRSRAEFVLDFVGSGDASWADVGGGSNVATWSTVAPASISAYYDRFLFHGAPMTTNAPLLIGDQFRLSGNYELHPSSALGQIFFLTNNSSFGFTLSNDDDAGLDLIRLWIGDGAAPTIVGLVGIDVGGTFDYATDAFGVASIDYDVYFGLGSGGSLAMSGSISDSSGVRYTFSTNFVISGLGSPPQDLYSAAIASDMIGTDDDTQGPPQLIANIANLEWGYSTVPEPTTAALLMLGALALCRRLRAARHNGPSSER